MILAVHTLHLRVLHFLSGQLLFDLLEAPLRVDTRSYTLSSLRDFARFLTAEPWQRVADGVNRRVGCRASLDWPRMGRQMSGFVEGCGRITITTVAMRDDGSSTKSDPTHTGKFCRRSATLITRGHVSAG